MGNTFNILSIDGGGYRGLFAAHVLKRIEKEFGVDWTDRFQLLTGTSTGSIITAGLACGVTADELAEFYCRHGKSIFTPRIQSRFDLLNLFTSRYSSTTLREILEETFGDRTLGEIDIPLILPAVDIDNGQVHVFKSKYHEQFTRDPEVKVSDAVLASCSAPTYFDPHVKKDYRLADGGIWANNPSLVGVIDAHYRLGVSFDDIRVLSIGTGTSSAFYPRRSAKWKELLTNSWQGWGIATRWQRGKLLDLILNLQSANAHNTLCLLLGESPLDPQSVLRLTFESDRPLHMDATYKTEEWISKADTVFTHHSAKIAEFLGIGDSK